MTSLAFSVRAISPAAPNLAVCNPDINTGRTMPKIEDYAIIGDCETAALAESRRKHRLALLA